MRLRGGQRCSCIRWLLRLPVWFAQTRCCSLPRPPLTTTATTASYDARQHPISRFYQNMDLRGIEISNASSAGPAAPPLPPPQSPPPPVDDSAPSEAAGAEVSTGDDFRGIPVSWGVSAKEEGKKQVRIQFCDMADLGSPVAKPRPTHPHRALPLPHQPNLAAPPILPRDPAQATVLPPLLVLHEGLGLLPARDDHVDP